jgi:hypothetical protein
MKTKGDYEGFPGWWIDDPASPDGKRFIATHYGWDLIKERVKQEANFRCQLNLSENCQGRSQWQDVHHRRGRGGGKRDDRITILGRRNLLCCCRCCHSLAKIERKDEIYGTALA